MDPDKKQRVKEGLKKAIKSIKRNKELILYSISEQYRYGLISEDEAIRKIQEIDKMLSEP